MAIFLKDVASSSSSSLSSGSYTAYKLDERTEGDFLVIRPTEKEWQPVEKLQRELTEAFTQEGIRWTPMPFHLSHFTLFMGFQALDPAERDVIMKRLSEKISVLEKSAFTIDLSRGTTKVKRGPRNYVTLHFESAELQKMVAIVKAVVTKAIEVKELDPEHINMKKLKTTAPSHITLGVVEDPQQEKILNDTSAKKAFGKKFASANKLSSVSKLTVQVAIKQVDFMGVKNRNSKVADRDYVTLATARLQGTTKATATAPLQALLQALSLAKNEREKNAMLQVMRNVLEKNCSSSAIR
ncbi:MAG TPA: hypothetical protein VN457_06970 [Chlamydiales bacterium]|nr:hypothetical protein [Chlamydiales bacterium]